MKKITLILIILIALACNKEKRYSKRLIKGDTWSVANISINGSVLNTNTYTWFVEGDDIYEHVPIIKWYANDGNETYFEWQFQDKGKSWVLNFYLDSSKCEGSSIKDIDYLANSISGKYEVVKHKRKEMHFKSSETRNYAGQEVEIKIIKK
jgi:hypothetical protein